MEHIATQYTIKRNFITKTFTPIDEIDKHIVKCETYDVKLSSIYAGDDFYSCEQYQKHRKSLIIANYKNMMLDGQRNIYDEQRRCIRYSVFRDEHMIFDYYILNGKGRMWMTNDNRFNKEIETHKAKVECEDYRFPCNIATVIYNSYMMNPEKYKKDEKQRLQGKRHRIVVNEYQKLYDQPILLIDDNTSDGSDTDTDSDMSDDPNDKDYIPDYNECDTDTDTDTDTDSDMSDDDSEDLKDEIIYIVNKLNINDNDYPAMFNRAVSILKTLMSSSRLTKVIIERLKMIDECDNSAGIIRNSIISLINEGTN